MTVEQGMQDTPLIEIILKAHGSISYAVKVDFELHRYMFLAHLR